MHRRELLSHHRKIVSLAFLVVIACWIIALIHPGSLESEPEARISPAVMSAWLLLQSVMVVVLPLALSWILLRWSVRGAPMIAVAALVSLPIVMVLDSVLFQWTGERLLSLWSLRFVTDWSHSLWPYVTQRMLFDGALLVAGLIAGCCGICFLSRFLAMRWDDIGLGRVSMTGWAVSAAVLVTPCIGLLVNPRSTAKWMARDSARHPLCIFRVLPFSSPDSGILVASVNDAAGGANGAAASEVAIVSSVEAAVAHREWLQRTAMVSEGRAGEHSPDVLIVVIESLRHELVQHEIMPELAAIADRGIHLRNHFSGGNATNHGMFCLVNGLDATWFERPVRFSPLLNRLFRDAGYQIGFFAGDNQWREFLMDGFIRPGQFDLFQVSPRDGLRSDRLATQNAAAFLGRTDGKLDASDRPRLAMVYLYGTHATYQSYLEDQVFQPAADDRIRYPYGSDQREQVWNRYKNSARTIDRLFSGVYRDDLVAVITGDHGESFLEDGTIGHGIKISAVQNMTPAVIYSPRLSSRAVRGATSHADLLPTLLELVGIELQSPGLFDGVSLASADEADLARRVLISRNYSDNVYGLIGPWTQDESAPFAYRASISLGPFQTRALNQIDAQGYGAKPTSEQAIQAALDRWREDRFP